MKGTHLALALTFTSVPALGLAEKSSGVRGRRKGAEKREGRNETEARSPTLTYAFPFASLQASQRHRRRLSCYP